MTLKAPFPWFGGKSRVAPEIWAYFGDVDNYIEPFAGSLAVLLGRPASHTGTCETVNDIDAYLSNFWRALAADPEQVAHFANWPVNENDLTARHIWLVNQKDDHVQKKEGDPDYFDAKIAGWWVWGISCWIGSGWCSGVGPWNSENGLLTKDAGQGVNKQRPHLGTVSQGVNRKMESLLFYFSALADRLAHVRVCCGDWRRVVTKGAMNYGNTVGVFLDPPYSFEDRDTVYNHDSFTLTADVIAWCSSYAENPKIKIALCGYIDEFEGVDLFRDWRRVQWTANRAYGSSNGASRNNENRGKEVILFSPSCVAAQPTLWNTLQPA